MQAQNLMIILMLNYDKTKTYHSLSFMLGILTWTKGEVLKAFKLISNRVQVLSVIFYLITEFARLIEETEHTVKEMFYF